MAVEYGTLGRERVVDHAAIAQAARRAESKAKVYDRATNVFLFFAGALALATVGVAVARHMSNDVTQLDKALIALPAGAALSAIFAGVRNHRAAANSHEKRKMDPLAAEQEREHVAKRQAVRQKALRQTMRAEREQNRENAAIMADGKEVGFTTPEQRARLQKGIPGQTDFFSDRQMAFHGSPIFAD